MKYLKSFQKKLGILLVKYLQLLPISYATAWDLTPHIFFQSNSSLKSKKGNRSTVNKCARS